MADVDAASIAERLLQLKCTRPFDGMDTRSLSVLAGAGREVVCSTRTQLAAEGERASAHWVPLTGRLEALRRGEPVPGEPIESGFGGLSLLTEQPMPVDLFAEAGTVLFVLDADALLETLEENGGLAREALRAMARSVLDARRKAGTSESAPVTVHSREQGQQFDLVSRMMLIRSAVGLQARNAAILTRLARVARVERLPPGRILGPAGPADLVVVVEGKLEGRPDDEDGPASGRGALYGLMETVLSVPRTVPVVTTTGTTVLVVSHSEIQEALEDDDRLCIGLIRLAALELWRAFWRAHPLPGA